MPACNTIVGITYSCTNNIAGLKRIWLANYADITGVTASSGNVTAMTTATATPFKEFQFNRNTSSIKESVVPNIENGTTFNTITLMLVLSKRESSKSNSLTILLDGQPKLVALVLDLNNNYWILGEPTNEGAYVTQLDSDGGVAKGDKNGYDITITSEQDNLAYTVSAAVVAAVIA